MYRVTNAGFAEGCGGIFCVVADGHDVRTSAESKDCIGHAGHQTNEAMRMVRHGDSTAGFICDDSTGEGGRRREKRGEEENERHALPRENVRMKTNACQRMATQCSVFPVRHDRSTPTPRGPGLGLGQHHFRQVFRCLLKTNKLLYGKRRDGFGQWKSPSDRRGCWSIRC